MAEDGNPGIEGVRPLREELQLELLKHHWELRVSAREATKDFAVSGINILFLLNGGAVIALVTLFAAMLSGWAEQDAAIQVIQICGNLLWFALGSAAAGLASICAYLTYEAYLNSISRPIDIYKWVESEPLSDGRLQSSYYGGSPLKEAVNEPIPIGIERFNLLTRYLFRKLAANWVAFGLTLCSAVFFVYGTSQIVSDMKNIVKNLPANDKLELRISLSGLKVSKPVKGPDGVQPIGP